MGEGNWYMRYRTAREYADGQAEHYLSGEDVDTHRCHTPYREITGAAWVAEAYDIAAEKATSLMNIEGAIWQPIVDECKRLAQKFREEASNPA